MTDNTEVRAQIMADANRRFATKKFDATKRIPAADWDTIMEVGRLSPSSFGYEPWQFVLVNNVDIKEDLKQMAWGAVNSLNGASHFLMIYARKNVTYNSAHVRHMVTDVMGSAYDENSTRTQFFKTFQEQNAGLTTPDKLFDWASKQTYIAMANMMDAATRLGIDTCPIEGFDKERTEAYLAAKGLLNRDEFGLSIMVGFGYRDQVQPAKMRQKLDAVYKVID